MVTAFQPWMDSYRSMASAHSFSISEPSAAGGRHPRPGVGGGDVVDIHWSSVKDLFK